MAKIALQKYMYVHTCVIHTNSHSITKKLLSPFAASSFASEIRNS